MKPTSGPTAGGNRVVIKGTSFVRVKKVVFGKVATRKFKVKNPRKLVVTAPPRKAGKVRVRVVTKSGASKRVPAARYTYLAPPVETPPAATLTGIAPALGPSSGGTAVTLTGTNLSSTTAVKFGGSAAAFAVESSTKIVATAPPHAPETVDVSVTTLGGSVVLPASFRFVAAPTLTAVSPDAGPTSGATTVTLTGTNFWPDTQVSFGGQLGAGVVVNQDGTQLTVSTPPHAAGLVDVSVSTPGGTATRTNAYTYFVPIGLEAITPMVGLAAGGQEVTLTGSGFGPGVQVTFGGVPAADLTVESGNELKVTTPAHPAGVVDVVVTGQGAPATLPAAYTYVDEPTIDAVTPAVALEEKTHEVVVTGSGFWPGMSVTFGDEAALEVTVQSSSQATVVAPARFAGTVDVVVTTVVGSATLPDGFRYTPPPVVLAVNPSDAPLTGGTEATVNGSFFDVVTQVWFGGEAVEFEILDSEQIRVTVPAGTPGPVDVTVGYPGGTSTLPDGFAYFGAPTIDSVSPDAGALVGGDSVTIHGTGFTEGTEVTFDGVAATEVTVLSSAEIMAVTPVHTVGTVDVTVTTSIGSATLEQAFTYLDWPAISQVGPMYVVENLEHEVTLTGEGFWPGMTVLFDGETPLDVTLISESLAKVRVPAHESGNVWLTVITPGGQATFADFYYLPAPVVTEFGPAAGPVDGGIFASITVTSGELIDKVLFGDVEAEFVPWFSDSLWVTTPPGVPGTVDVTIIWEGGSVTLPDAFTYYGAPTVTGISVTAGPLEGGQTVTISGTNFYQTTHVAFDGLWADVTVVSDTEITVETPVHAAGVVDVVIMTESGSVTLTEGYTYIDSPTVAGLSPLEGPADGGLPATITGTNFVPGATSVTFGGVAALSVEVVSSTELIAVTPPHSGGYVHVVVSTPSGSATLVDGHRFIVGPTLTGVSPAAGPTSGGAVVTLTGTGFRPGIVVRFGGVVATDVVVQEGGAVLTARTPAHAAGLVDVVVETSGGVGVLGEGYAYVAP